MHWRRKWQPTPVFLPGESHGQRSLVGCSPWGRTESDTTEATWQQLGSSSDVSKKWLPAVCPSKSGPCFLHLPIPRAQTKTGVQQVLSQSVSSVAQLCLTLCDPVDCSTPGLPAHHQIPESTQTHVHRVGDAIQPSHPLSSPSPPTFNLFQHQGLFQ